MNWNKMMMEAILAKDEKTFQEKKDAYVKEYVKVAKL